MKETSLCRIFTPKQMRNRHLDNAWRYRVWWCWWCAEQLYMYSWASDRSYTVDGIISASKTLWIHRVFGHNDRKPYEFIGFSSIRKPYEFIWFLIIIRKSYEFIWFLNIGKPYEFICFLLADLKRGDFKDGFLIIQIFVSCGLAVRISIHIFIWYLKQLDCKGPLWM